MASYEPQLQNLSLGRSISNSSSVQSLKHGYIDKPFLGKKDQYEQVLDILDSTGFIPESLIELETHPGIAQERPRQCFEKYIDSLIDLLLKQYIPGVKDSYVDLYNKQEILFLGPDEGTAGYVDWATNHARSRGAPWWRSFLTGKSPQLGGIPHDEYGMTSLSVRAYVNKIYENLNLESRPIRKLQTGGPDGDLGSNEIKLSTPNEVYVAIVDGSGVIVDPQGLNKDELLRLADQRKMIDHFDSKLLSPQGFRVLVDDVDVKIPNGEIITSGVAFRNGFHINFKDVLNDENGGGIDLFVPCGGRPGAIDTNNVYDLINPKTGKSIIPYFVEGANLFITQSAKLVLENAGTIIFKDASTNKGGVTSSSLEVLAALAFDDNGFLSNMCVDEKTGAKPKLYQDYVKNCQRIIVKNAQSEFQSLWDLKKVTGVPITELSDKFSFSICFNISALASFSSSILVVTYSPNNAKTKVDPPI
ncbi:glutamate dehydrogenase (NADP(+)) gdh1 [Cerrena zonata]|uniref:Glutamate dehydrogenase (NADP(+)) gdh1 n=1 Tax=Cerrena zonata TaxID=2478898 RepID=A0AAW0FNL0_9APHY